MIDVGHEFPALGLSESMCDGMCDGTRWTWLLRIKRVCYGEEKLFDAMEQSERLSMEMAQTLPASLAGQTIPEQTITLL